jgi:hypothetical protein
MNTSTAPQMRQAVCHEASSYKTRENAMKKLKKVFGDDLANVRYVILCQPDGRFSPAVLGAGMAWVCHKGICNIG